MRTGSERQRSALDLAEEGAGERLGMGKRDHVAGALDQGVLCVRNMAPNDAADGVVDGGRIRSLDEVDRRSQRGERVDGEEAIVEQNVP